MTLVDLATLISVAGPGVRILSTEKTGYIAFLRPDQADELQLFRYNANGTNII